VSEPRRVRIDHVIYGTAHLDAARARVESELRTGDA
jgi:hypothetical protein